MSSSISVRDRLADAIADLVAEKQLTGRKHNASGTPTTVFAHGPTGVFSYPGIDPRVFSAILGTEPGLMGRLPKLPSQFTNPIYMSLTGVQDDVGSEPSAVCDPAPVAGLLKSCRLTSVFGRYTRQTRELYLPDLGRRRDNADPMDLVLANAYAANGDILSDPAGSVGLSSDVMKLETAKVMFEFGTSVNRLLNRQIWRGNPSNNSANRGYEEMTGIDLLVSTGKKDAITGDLCASLDSLVQNFNYHKVNEFSTGFDIVQTLTYMYRSLRSNARRSGMLPATWAFVMREELFYEISAIWPCAYLTSRCTFRTADGSERLNVDARSQVEMTDAMRARQYLLIDGMEVEVIFDDAIPQETSTTTASVSELCFASDIYLLPLTVAGGVPTLYMEYYDQGNPDANQALGEGHLGGQVWTTNGGAWVWSAERSRLCMFWQGTVQPRLILRTPQLAGVLQNVQYCPFMPVTQPFPTDPYFKNGGVYGPVAGPSLYSEWNG